MYCQNFKNRLYKYRSFQYRSNKKNKTDYLICKEPRCTASAVLDGNFLSSSNKEHNDEAVLFLMQTDAFESKLIH